LIESVSINADYNRYTVYCQYRVPNWEIRIKKPDSKRYNFFYLFLSFFFYQGGHNVISSSKSKEMEIGHLRSITDYWLIIVLRHITDWLTPSFRLLIYGLL